MDIVSHGLWGGVGFGRKNRKSFLIAFGFGIAPDFFSFGIYFIQRFFGRTVDFAHQGRPDLINIPAYVNTLYNITHSLIIFSLIFALVWFFFKKPIWEMCAWGFHVSLDIFTHSYDFFPTPFLWPIFNFKIDGMSWGHPIIFFFFFLLLALAYSWFIYKRKSKHE